MTTPLISSLNILFVANRVSSASTKAERRIRKVRIYAPANCHKRHRNNNSYPVLATPMRQFLRLNRFFCVSETGSGSEATRKNKKSEPQQYSTEKKANNRPAETQKSMKLQ